MMNYIYKKIINKYDYISFDIFDTLIERKVDNPSDIFYLAAIDVLGFAEADEFVSMRINAERLARKKSSFKEINLDQIYDSLLKKYRKKTQILKESEIKKELEFCSRITKMYELLCFAKSKGKKVLLISDMYLPETIIERILVNCDIKLYDALYVSNKYNCVKLDGSLFSYVLDQQKIAPKDIVHFGDSIKADFLGSRKVGVNSILIHRNNRWKRMFLCAKKEFLK